MFNLANDFSTIGHICHVSSGSIKKVQHKDTGYILALKTYDKKLLNRKSQVLAIHREIYIMAVMDHPNIVKLYEVIDTKSHVHLVMELCEGKSLADHISKGGDKVKGPNDKVVGCLSEKQAKGLFKQMVNAVDYMHSMNIV